MSNDEKQRRQPQTLAEALAVIEEQEHKLADLELRKAQYDSILENMSEFVERSGPDYSLRYVNEALCELYECDGEELLGRNTLELMEAEDRERIDFMTKIHTPEDPCYQYEYKVRKKDGSLIWVESVGRAFFDGEGKVIEYQDVGRDVTHFKHMEERLTHSVAQRTKELNEANHELMRVNAYLNSILGSVREGIAVVKKNGACEFLNQGPEQRWQRYNKVIAGRFMTMATERRSNVLKKLLHEGKPFIDEEIRCQYDGGQISFLVTGLPLRAGDTDTAVAVLVLTPMKEIHDIVNRMSGVTATFHFQDIVTNSKQLQDAIALAKQSAAADCTILIEGESGTGKELFAQSIHNSSPRRKGPFVAINCGAIPRELVASELFGYVEGAFTGARKGGKPGKFELAQGGTLFLDEVGDMPMEQQVTLLRVLQERKVVRVGGYSEIPVDVRIICATNRNLYNEVQQNNFRDDLYYRLNVINFRIPPLRKRKEDILLLFSTFLKRGKSSEEVLQHIDPLVLEALINYDWPGNVRELQNVAEHVLYLAKGREILPQALPRHILDDLPEKAAVLSESVGGNSSLYDIRADKKRRRNEREREMFLAALDAADGNATVAAQSLGISRATFYRKWKMMEEQRQ